MSIKITVINGPNLNLLHLRDSQLYGNIGLPEIESSLKIAFPDIAFDFFQSNIEGELIEKIQNCIKEQSAIIINPGGYSHTSVAIHDALELISMPKIEVHLSNIHNRESYRHHSLTAAACHGIIAGLKENGYLLAVQAILKLSL
jgi:3-dehydroquinate dehydratase II